MALALTSSSEVLKESSTTRHTICLVLQFVGIFLTCGIIFLRKDDDW